MMATIGASLPLKLWIMASSIELVEVEWMTGALREEREEGELGPAVAFAEGMYRVELGEEVRSFR